MTIPSAVPRGTESDSLMTQITPDNVLAMYGVLSAQAEAIDKALFEADDLRHIEACGGDPVSLAARDQFQAKINYIIDVHKAHLEEVREAAKRLADAAREWQHTEDEIDAAYAAARHKFSALRA